MSGFAGLVVIARINAADSSLGEDLLLPAIAAVCLGGTSLFGGVGGIVGTAIGSLILALIVNGMNLLGVQTFWQNARDGRDHSAVGSCGSARGSAAGPAINKSVPTITIRGGNTWIAELS